MSVNSHLTDLASALVLSDSERTSITTSISTLSGRLKDYFGSGITGQLQFGSSTRGTILPRKADEHSDVDYMVIFATSDGKKKPQTYLDRLLKFAENKYATSEIHQSHPTVVLALNHINFELVPAIYEYGYQIPSPASSWTDWVYTDPTKTDSALQDKNKENNYQIKPLVRLVKYWNAKNGYPYLSFSLEEHIRNSYFFGGTALKDYFYSFWSNFNYSYDVAQWIKDKVDLAKKRAAAAKDYEDRGYPVSAEDEIKKIVPSL